MLRASAVLMAIVFSPALPDAPAQEQPSSDPESPVSGKSAEQTQRTAEMRQLAAKLSFTESGEAHAEPHLLVKEPLLHFSGADRGITDGTLWAYGHEGRPVALLEIYCGRHVPAGVYRHAWTAVSDRPLILEGAPGIKWTPRTSGVDWTAMTDAPMPASAATVRLRQFKALTRRFRAHQIFDAGTQREELRLLVQPLTATTTPSEVFATERCSPLLWAPIRRPCSFWKPAMTRMGNCHGISAWPGAGRRPKSTCSLTSQKSGPCHPSRV